MRMLSKSTEIIEIAAKHSVLGVENTTGAKFENCLRNVLVTFVNTSIDFVDYLSLSLILETTHLSIKKP